MKAVRTGLSSEELARLYKKAFLENFVAIYYLKMLGFKFDSDYYNELKQNYDTKKNEKNKKQKNYKIDDEINEYDDGSFYIAGYTSGGTSYGSYVKKI